MNVWLWAAAALLVALVPCAVVCFGGRPANRLVALDLGSVLVNLVLLLLVQGFHRTPFYDLPLTLALLAFGGGMVFAHFQERWW